MSERKKFSLSAVVLILLLREDEVLLMRRQNTGWHDGDYDVPGGHIDGGETFSEALVREASEEIGIKIKQEDAHFAHLLHYVDDTEYIYAFFRVEEWQGEPAIMEPHKCDDLRWFSVDKLPNNITPVTREVIEKYRLNIPYSEYTPSK